MVVHGPSSPTPAGFKASTVTTWAAVSSVLFVLTVLLSQGLEQLFKFERKTIADGIDEPFYKRSLAVISLLLQVLVLGAFLFLELVLTAYSPKVGWIGIAFTSVLALIAFVLWLAQAMNKRPVHGWVGSTFVEIFGPDANQGTSIRKYFAGKGSHS